MPLYDYSCDSCGEFRDWKDISQSSKPAPCPSCGNPSVRTIASPFLADMSSNTRIAHQRNEKSAHEPKIMSRKELDRSGTRRSGAHGHDGHCHGHGHGSGNGMRQHVSSRPWMIGH